MTPFLGRCGTSPRDVVSSGFVSLSNSSSSNFALYTKYGFSSSMNFPIPNTIVSAESAPLKVSAMYAASNEP